MALVVQEEVGSKAMERYQRQTHFVFGLAYRLSLDQAHVMVLRSD